MWLVIDLFALDEPQAMRATFFAALAGKGRSSDTSTVRLADAARLGFMPGRVLQHHVRQPRVDAGARGVKTCVSKHWLEETAVRESGPPT